MARGPVIYRLKGRIPAGSMCRAGRVLEEVERNPERRQEVVAAAIFEAYCSGYETGRAYQRGYARKKLAVR